MGVCRDVFVLIQQKLAEKIYPGRIYVYSATVKKTDFLPGCFTEHSFFAPYLSSLMPTSDLSFNLSAYTFAVN